MSLDGYAFGKLPQCLLIGDPFDLHPIRTWMLKPGIGQAMLEPAIIGQQEQPFTVVVEPANRIHTFYLNEVLERAPFAGELAYDPIGFVKENVSVEHQSPSLHTLNQQETVPLEFSVWSFSFINMNSH